MSYPSLLTKVLHRLLVVTVVIMPFWAKPAQAVPFLLTQQWENRANSLDTLKTNALFDDDTVANVGITRILMDRFNVIRFLSGVAQSSEIARFTDPPSFAVEGNTFVGFNNAVFSGIGNVDLGGSGRVSLVNQTTNTVFASYIVNGSEFFRFIDPSGTFRYDLVSSQLTDLTSNGVPVPSPATLSFFLPGIIGFGLILLRRRMRAV